jgi:hypothetical protein
LTRIDYGSKSQRDIEKLYSKAEFVAKLRRLADAIESGARFETRIAGERIYVPVSASFSVEHENPSAKRKKRKWNFKSTGSAASR